MAGAARRRRRRISARRSTGSRSSRRSSCRALRSSLWRFWLVRGLYDEGQTGDRACAAPRPDAGRARRAVYQLGAIVISRGDTARGRTLFQESLDRFRAAGVQRGEARSLSALGHVAADAGEWTRGDRPLRRRQRARPARSTTGSGSAACSATSRPCTSARARPSEALPLAIESRAIQREVGNREGEALALATQGTPSWASAISHRAREALDREHRGRAPARLPARAGVQPERARRCSPSARRRSAARDLFEAAQALRESIGIEHDPDDALVAGDREAAGHTANGASSDFDLERVVEVALAG